MTLQERISQWVDAHEAELIRDIGRLVAVKSVRGEPGPDAPFGPGPRAALDEALALCSEYGFATEIYGCAVGTADLNDQPSRLDILGHLDVVVEGDGSVYPCDFYCTDEWLLGNINENDFNELFNSKFSVTFLKDSFKIGDDCKKCDYFTLCRGGGCKRNRQNADYCKAYKDFFASSYNMILQMSR